jgi:HD-GYP domain-containing protein (c-di-GMP phosphodiesterase class II)
MVVKKSKLSILFIGQDLEFEKQICDCFVGDEFQYQSVKSTKTAVAVLESRPFDVVVFDEDILNRESYNEQESKSSLEIYELALSHNPKAVYFYLYLKNNTFIKEFQKRNQTTLLFHREKIQLSRISYAIELLGPQTMQPIILREVSQEYEYPMSLFKPGKDEDYSIALNEPGEKISALAFEQLRAEHIKHVYVKNSDYNEYLDLEMRDRYTGIRFSEQFNLINKKIRYLLSELLDDSYLGDPNNGAKLTRYSYEIIDDMIQLIDAFKGLYRAADELPFPRSSMLSHYFNITIYTLIFSKLGGDNYNRDLAIASLIHDIGLSKIDFHLLKKNKSNFTIKEKIDVEQHVELGIQTLHNKMFNTNHIIEQAILKHHEHWDGTGYPRGLSQSQIGIDNFIISVADGLDSTRTVKFGQKIRTLDEALLLLKKKGQQSLLGIRYDRQLIEMLIHDLLPPKKKSA